MLMIRERETRKRPLTLGPKCQSSFDALSLSLSLSLLVFEKRRRENDDDDDDGGTARDKNNAKKAHHDDDDVRVAKV